MSTGLSLLFFWLENPNSFAHPQIIQHRLGEFELSGLWLGQQLAIRCKKLLEKRLQYVCLVLLFLPTHPLSVAPGERTLTWMDLQTA